MIGVIITAIATFFEELATAIGKTEVKRHQECVYTMGFLNLFWGAVAFLLISIFVPGSFVFKTASLFTFLPRVALEILQTHFTLKAVVLATRSSFSFIRSLTIPLLLTVDIFLGYAINMYQILGISLIILTLLFLYMNHGIEHKGAKYTIFTAINAAITISLYKYDITRFNSVVAEQLLICTILVIYFYFAARFYNKENPIKFLKKPIFALQSLSQGFGGGIESFAIAFAPASVILAAKRSMSIFWSVLAGNVYFHERHLALKLLAFFFLAGGIVILAAAS